MGNHIPTGMSLEHQVLASDCFMRALMKTLLEKKILNTADAAGIAMDALTFVSQELEHRREAEEKKEK